MNIDFTFKNFEPSEHLKKYARRRFEKITRFLGKSPALQMQVILSVDKFHHKAEISLTGEGLNINAAESSKDMYATIDMISDKISSQVRRSSEKLHSRQKAAMSMSIFTAMTFLKKTVSKLSTAKKTSLRSLCTWTKRLCSSSKATTKF